VDDGGLLSGGLRDLRCVDHGSVLLSEFGWRGGSVGLDGLRKGKKRK
jgi:hypothetical protein